MHLGSRGVGTGGGGAQYLERVGGNMVSPPQYLALILQNGAKIAHGLSHRFVEKLTASGGFPPWTPIKVLIDTHFHMFGGFADPERSAAPPNLANLPTPLGRLPAAQSLPLAHRSTPAYAMIFYDFEKLYRFALILH